MQFGEIAVPVGAAIAGGIADGAAGDFFKNKFVLQNLQFGEIAIPVGAAIAGGIASGAAGAAFSHF